MMTATDLRQQITDLVGVPVRTLSADPVQPFVALA